MNAPALTLPASFDPAEHPELTKLADAYNAGVNRLNGMVPAEWIGAILAAVPAVFEKAVLLEDSFDLYEAADRRGIEMWRAEKPHARALSWPDKGRLVAWLLAEHDRRVTELLEANNADVERRRAAERQVRELEARVQELEERCALLETCRQGVVSLAHQERQDLLLRWVPRCIDAEAERDLLLVEVTRQAAELERLKAEHEPTGYFVSDLTEEQIASIREAFQRPGAAQRLEVLEEPRRDQVIAVPCPTAQALRHARPVVTRDCMTCASGLVSIRQEPCCGCWNRLGRPNWTLAERLAARSATAPTEAGHA